MVKFELGHEMWKVNWSTWQEHGTKKQNKKQPIPHQKLKSSPSLFTYHYSQRLQQCWPYQYAGCLSHMNSAKWPYCPWVLVAQWIERPPNVWEVMHSILVRDSDFFLCPRLMSCWPIHLSHFITKLKVHHLYSLITIIDYVQVEYAQALGFHSNVSSTGSLLLDYEQSLFFLSPSNKTRENTHACDWRRGLPPSFLASLAATLSHARGKWRKKKETARSLHYCDYKITDTKTCLPRTS